MLGEQSTPAFPAAEPTPAYLRTVVRQAIVAMALIVGFYVFSIATVLGLFGLSYALLHLGLFGFPPAGIAFAAALIMLVILFPPFHRFKAPGPRIRAKDQPGLFALIADVAKATNQPLPREVYLIPQANAFVTERGGIFGFGKRRVLAIGLPLLAVMDVAQLRGVLAHEFGHYYGGDTRLAPWIYRAHNKMLVMAEGLARSGYGAWVNLFLLPYIEFYLHITLQISRHQELAADRLAARVAGPDAASSGLKLLSVIPDLFEAYWEASILPLAGAGYLPPIMEGLGRFAEAGAISNSVTRQIKLKVQESRGDRFVRYSTHPSLAQRLDALAGLGGSDDAGRRQSAKALTLAVDVPRLERRMLAEVIDKKRVEKLKPVEWDGICMEVYYPTWIESVRADGAGLAGVTPEALPDIVKNLGAFSVRCLEKSQRRWAADDDAMWNERVSATIGAALSVALHKAGWTLRAAPGEPVRVERGDDVILPFEVLGKLVSRNLTADAWREVCRRAGIAGVDFGAMLVAELPTQSPAIH